MSNELKIFSGNSNPDLAKEIADFLNLPLGRIELGLLVVGLAAHLDGDIAGLWTGFSIHRLGARSVIVECEDQDPGRRLSPRRRLVDRLHPAEMDLIRARIPIPFLGR